DARLRRLRPSVLPPHRPPPGSPLLPYTTRFRSVPVGLATIAESTALQRGDLLAGAALIGIPMVIAMTFVGRYFIRGLMAGAVKGDRKSTRLNSSHVSHSYAVFCLQIKTLAGHRT